MPIAQEHQQAIYEDLLATRLREFINNPPRMPTGFEAMEGYWQGFRAGGDQMLLLLDRQDGWPTWQELGAEVMRTTGNPGAPDHNIGVWSLVLAMMSFEQGVRATAAHDLLAPYRVG